MISNKGRLITLVVEITTDEYPEWIWEAHKNPFSGVRVRVIAEGNLSEENEKLEKAACFYLREEGEDTEEAISRSPEPFDSVEDIIREADSCTSKGAKWDAIDRHGNVYASGVNSR